MNDHEKSQPKHVPVMGKEAVDEMAVIEMEIEA